MGSLFNDGLDIGGIKMTNQNIEELEFETTSRYIVYDAESGEILYIHECMKQKGTYETEADPGEYEVLRIAMEDFEKRNLKVMKAQDGFEMEPDVTYSVDTYSGELKKSSANTMTFREFLKQPE